MKMQKLLIICSMLFYGCNTFHYTSNDISGTYTQIRDDSLKSYIDLSLNQTNFALVDVGGSMHSFAGRLDCCDTIASGSWNIDNQHGVLSLTTALSMNSYLSDNVFEDSTIPDDSIYFYISNPIERNMGKKHKNIFYTIDVYSDDMAFVDSFYNKGFYTNRIVMPNREHSKINYFSVRIYTTPEYTGRSIIVNPVRTVFYYVKNRRSNTFKIDIPKLTYQYITYLRFEDHLLKIVNKNELIWDGVMYEKLK